MRLNRKRNKVTIEEKEYIIKLLREMLQMTESKTRDGYGIYRGHEQYREIKDFIKEV